MPASANRPVKSSPSSTRFWPMPATIYLSDIGTFAQMNAEWDKWVPQGHTPARATVEAKLAAPNYKVEIAIIAAV
jgi:enamine deaminase RidA (YjgF/YER057c/UK114 family)